MSSSTSGFSAEVVQSRKRYKEGLLSLHALHDSGGSALEVSHGLADLWDDVVLGLFDEALNQAQLDHPENMLALVAHGGYGRRDVSPYSDADLMLLHAPEYEQAAGQVAKSLCQWIGDTGMLLGFSLRTAPQALKLAWSDATVFTTLVESRQLAGSQSLFESFFRAFREGTRKRSKRLIALIEKSRREERRKYGETVFLLEPNIKRSRGGLRDVQLVRWLGFAQYGEADLSKLESQGHLSQEDFQSLRDAHLFLLRLRHQMHFVAGKTQDQLDRALQMQMAQWAGYTGAEGILPVEQFMQEYFAHTSEIRYSSAHVLESAKYSSLFVQSLEHTMAIRVQRDYRVGIRHVWATPAGLDRLTRDTAAVLELMSISSRYGKPIEHETWRQIRIAMRNRPVGQIDPVTIRRFWELMSSTTGLAGQLRRLHELRVLEQVIPEMTHARCLLQFNQYHKYTVDAHSIRAVECVTELESNPSLLGVIYRGLKHKAILHLALLIHDLGKGYPEDHSEVGRRIALNVADRLQLSPQDQETLAFLVHQHLLLALTAFRYDLSDRAAAVRFAAVVGSSERLQLLLLLTYADLASVGPDVVNQWKIDLLLQLYYQTDAHFRDDKPGEGFRAEIASRRQAVLDAVTGDADQDWWQQQVEALPIGYLMRSSPKELVGELEQFKLLDQQPCLAWGKYIESQKAIEFTIATQQHGRLIGTFHRITGALTSQEMQILNADIHTQPGNIAWDRFLVEDPQSDGRPSDSRIEAVCQAIRRALDPDNPATPTFAKKWNKYSGQAAANLKTQPTLVRFDNSTSDHHTIITLFAYDRMGLLYDVSKVLFDMELVLHVAKISTHLDQVVDVFYVSDLEGKKVEESTALYLIRQRLLLAVK
ncbi:MAG: [protein-PII] uridylyltransferase [Pirellulaceae bacterium]|nr:[protein-PII] uridylyltransferase [Pirellulaceae bacterium]